MCIVMFSPSHRAYDSHDGAGAPPVSLPSLLLLLTTISSSSSNSSLYPPYHHYSITKILARPYYHSRCQLLLAVDTSNWALSTATLNPASSSLLAASIASPVVDLASLLTLDSRVSTAEPSELSVETCALSLTPMAESSQLTLC